MTGFGPYPLATYHDGDPQPCAGKLTPAIRRCNGESHWEIWAAPCCCWVTSCPGHLDQLLRTVMHHDCPAELTHPRRIEIRYAWRTVVEIPSRRN